MSNPYRVEYEIQMPCPHCGNLLRLSWGTDPPESAAWSIPFKNQPSSLVYCSSAFCQVFALFSLEGRSERTKHSFSWG